MRSDDKGPEPEDLVLGRIGGRPYLFVGLERANGVMAFDVSEPESPLFAGFIGNPFDPAFMTVTNADGTTKADGEEPERLDFVPAPQPYRAGAAVGHQRVVRHYQSLRVVSAPIIRADGENSLAIL